ncbi:MAG: MFS transporter [Thermococci archaeon]|nr:MFS transporter [Thermococci archaeon]
MGRNRWLVVLIDTLLLTVGFAGMTMMGLVQGYMTEHYGISSSSFSLQGTAYVIGIFVAFLLGGTRLFKGSFKRSALLVVSFAAIPQFIIPYVGNWYGVVALRFFQGFIVALIPLFSTQIAGMFVAERPFAKGIILSGIFWGGIFGTQFAKALIPSIPPKLKDKLAFVTAHWSSLQHAFILMGIIMYAVLALWWVLTDDFVIPHRSGTKKGKSVWKMPFTWVFGFSFFPALWIIFTIIQFSNNSANSIWPNETWRTAMLVNVLNVSMGIWSIIMGFIGYRLSVRNTSSRGLFKAIVSVMLSSYAVTFIGLLIYWRALSVGNFGLALLGAAIVGIVQGTGPAFWTSAPATYPKSIFPQASFALGLISNSSNAVAPVVVLQILAGRGIDAAMMGFIVMPILGIVLLITASRMRLPVEMEGEAESETAS